MRVRRDSPLPIAYQLEQALRQQIERGELAPGDRLPTEQALCQLHGISRTPVRHALGRLADAGLIRRIQGSGSVVVGPGGAPSSTHEPVTLKALVLSEAWCGPLQSAANELAGAGQPVRLLFNVVEMGSLLAQISLAIARGDAPDIMLIDSVWVADFAARGFLWSFDHVSASIADALSADLLPPLRAANTVSGHLCALPAEADHSLIWYRRDWLARAGIAPPMTWEAWRSAMHQFQREAIRRELGLGAYPLAFCGGSAAGETTTYQLLPLLWAAGADVFAGGEVVLDSSAAIAAVTFLADLVRRDRLAPPEVVSAPWNAPALAFAAGRVAFAIGGSYESSLIRAATGWNEDEFQKRVGMLPMPAGPGGTPSSITGGVSYAIPRQSKQAATALAIIARAIQPRHWEPLGARRGVNPPTISGTSRLSLDTNPRGALAASLLPYARERWPMVDYPRISAQITAMFERAIGGEPPAASVARAAAVISGLTGLPEPGERWRRQPGAQYPLLRIN